jgi:hypothetical protein
MPILLRKQEHSGPESKAQITERSHPVKDSRIPNQNFRQPTIRNHPQ